MLSSSSSDTTLENAAIDPDVHLDILRHFTQVGSDPLDAIKWTKRKSVIKEPDGTVVFEMNDAEAPEGWSQLAVDVAVSKYFRKAGLPGVGYEKSVRQLVERVAKTMRSEGVRQGLLTSTELADTFEAELSYMLVNQIGAFNSPVWFNCGLYHQYGITGTGGNFAWDETSGKVVETADAYSRPQVSACFIQSVGDDLTSIFDLVKNESRVFKYGSGTGTNFSKLRGDMEHLSGGGLSSGLLSFLEVLDRGAGATKSGGTTRRAAKMVIVDMDHPEIDKFITWKKREEKKVAALIAGGYPSDFNGEAYRTVAGQNSNNSVRVSDAFMTAVDEGADWSTKLRTTGAIHKTYKAKDLWRSVADASWSCADPGIQFDDTINKWHTCKSSGRINGSNPCSEYMFLDDTACNLASVNLLKFLDEEGHFDVEGFRHACRVFFLAQEIAVDLASYPTPKIAKNSHDYRTLGLGYANLGTLLMVMGLPYDSEAGRAIAGALTSLMTGEAYALSAEMASVKGPFPGYGPNRESMLGVMQLHRESARAIPDTYVPGDLLGATHECWDRAIALGDIYGYRNAQATVLAPTGTIGLLMDCDTTGVEPDFALVKVKKLAGGGQVKIVNQSVPRALKTLGYANGVKGSEIDRIVTYALGTNTLASDAPVNVTVLKAKGLTDEEIAIAEKQLPSCIDIRHAFQPKLMPAAYERSGVKPESKGKTTNLLSLLGFTADQIDQSSDIICGRQTVEGCAELKPEHLAVFDCANRCGVKGVRYIEPMGHVRMMAATQPFLSGAISKTINLPNEATIEDFEQIHEDSWKLGLKAIALYRDGCKLSQPLNTSKKEEKPAEQPVVAAPVSAVPVLPNTRNKLPRKAKADRYAFKVGSHKGYLIISKYPDGRPGELFIETSKEGAPLSGWADCFAIALSLGLQYGVPVETFVRAFRHVEFDPKGLTNDPEHRFAKSLPDYVAGVLEREYLRKEPEPEVTAPVKAAEPEHAERVSTFVGQSDAPFCDTCGAITVRNGACFKCVSCGTSLGCS
jgi:ribonucleoside-diphosphate reductase alpha chain